MTPPRSCRCRSTRRPLASRRLRRRANLFTARRNCTSRCSTGSTMTSWACITPVAQPGLQRLPLPQRLSIRWPKATRHGRLTWAREAVAQHPLAVGHRQCTSARPLRSILRCRMGVGCCTTRSTSCCRLSDEESSVLCRYGSEEVQINHRRIQVLSGGDDKF